MSNSIKKEVIIGDCRLILGDAKNVLPTLPHVNCIVSDLPYKLQSGGNTTGEMGGKFARGTYDNSGSIIKADIEFHEFMPLLPPLMPRGHAYFMVNNRWVAACQNEALAAGFRFHNILVWDKTSATPNRWYMKNCEFTLFLFTGAANPINDCGSKQLIRVPNVLAGQHETEKPVSLMEHYITNSTNAGEVVLDPFMGGGTTGVACVKLGRKFVGIEIVERHFETACQRVYDASNQRNLF